MKTFKKSQIVFVLLLFAYCIYAGFFIYRTSFVIDGERYFTLFDDAMISMRYAKNLANGYGLVWNPGGERVEGYTNPLWVLYMSIFHLFSIPQSKISVFIQISGALLLTINLFFVKKIAALFSNNSTFVSLSSVFLTAFYLPLNNWSLQGMEVSALTLIMSISILKTAQYIKSNTLSISIWLYILLGVGILIRIDMVVPFIAILSFVLISNLKNRNKNFILGFIVLVLFVLLQTLFRIWYYGEILPNTYYLKMTGYPFFLRISRGLYITFNLVWQMNWLLFLAPFGCILFRRDKVTLFLFWIFFVQVIYSIYVGGDAWEWWGGSNRYVCIVIPVFFILFSHGLVNLIYFLINKIYDESAFIKNYTKYAVSILVFISLVNFNTIYGIDALGEWLLIKRPLHVEGNKGMTELGLLLSKITSHQAKIAVVLAGATPYFSNRYSIDLLGKNDKKVAHENMRPHSDQFYSRFSKYINFYPGHMKWNYSHSIGKLKPDIVAQLWWSPEEAKLYLDNDYRKVKLQDFTFYLLKKSPNILWEKLKTSSEWMIKFNDPL